jgi:GH43 family beta-xylosidase
MLLISSPPSRLQASESATFINPLYRGADPWVIRRDRHYYSCNTGGGNRIEIWKSDSLVERGECRTVWSPPRRGWNRAQVWAPELHYLRGRWYIYYAASDGRNANHRMGVLEAATDDPQGPYIDRGMLNTAGRWAIDGTVLDIGDQLYFIWSGWEDHRDMQHLYAAPMSDPCTAAGDKRVMLCPNDCHAWERVSECHSQRGLHEGPQILQRDGRVFLVYSCSGSWQHTYKLGMLELSIGGNPLCPLDWTKRTMPVFESTDEVFGVGHCCFTQSPDGSEDWIVYHSKNRRSEGWRDRVVRAQPFTWRADGTPHFGTPVMGPIAAPSKPSHRQLEAA